MQAGVERPPARIWVTPRAGSPLRRPHDPLGTGTACLASHANRRPNVPATFLPPASRKRPAPLLPPPPAGSPRPGFSILGLTSVPMAVAPLLLLALTQLLLPHASLLGHVSGMAAGSVLAAGWLDWLTPYWTLCVCTWVAIGGSCLAARGAGHMQCWLARCQSKLTEQPRAPIGAQTARYPAGHTVGLVRAAQHAVSLWSLAGATAAVRDGCVANYREPARAY